MAGTGESLSDTQRDGRLTVDALAGWIDHQADKPLFAFLHLYEPHAPYTPPERFAQYSPYDGEIAYADEIVGRLIHYLKTHQLYDRSTIVLLSDHGEGLGEHQEPVHGFIVYQTTLKVPLIVRGPGVPADTRVPVVFRSVDLFPTVLDLVGLPLPRAPGPVAGRSLAAAFRGVSMKLEEESAFAESLTPRIHYG